MSDLGKFVWSNDSYKVDKFVELFSLPQIVRIKTGLQEGQNKNDSAQIRPNDTVLLHSVRRDIEAIRATDHLRNEFFLPLNSKARVEVIWKDYKKHYDCVEELFHHFPAHVLAMENDEYMALKKGDVLKLKRKITIRDEKYLQCTILNKVPSQSIDIPFGYKGLFRTLGDLKEETVTLSDAVEYCKLPRVVKFMDDTLKIMKTDGFSKSPMSLCSSHSVTLHEVLSYSDVISCKMAGGGGVAAVRSIPLDGDVTVVVPTARSRSDPSYAQLCVKTSAMRIPLRNVGIYDQRSHWVVFQNDDIQLSSSSSPNSLPQVNITYVTETYEVESQCSEESGRAKYKKPPPLPPVEMEPPPLPPKIPTRDYMGQGLSKTPPPPRASQRLRTGSEGNRMVSAQNTLFVPDTRRKSKSFPRILTPTQSSNGLVDPSDRDSSDRQGIREVFTYGNTNKDVKEIIIQRFNGSENMDSLDGYVTMKNNVHKLSESLYEDMHSYQTQLSTDKRTTGCALIDNRLLRPPRVPTSPFSTAAFSADSRIVETETHVTVTNVELVAHAQYAVIPALQVKADKRNNLDSVMKPPKNAVTKSSKKSPPGMEFIDGKDLRSWSQSEVSTFLKFLKLGEYVKLFKEKKIDGKILSGLSESSLKDLKVKKAHGMRLIKFVKECIVHETK